MKYIDIIKSEDGLLSLLYKKEENVNQNIIDTVKLACTISLKSVDSFCKSIDEIFNFIDKNADSSQWDGDTTIPTIYFVYKNVEFVIEFDGNIDYLNYASEWVEESVKDNDDIDVYDKIIKQVKKYPLIPNII